MERMRNKQPQIGDNVLEEIFYILNNSNIGKLKKGDVIHNLMFLEDFLRYFYECATKLNTNNGMKIYDKTLRVPILNTPNGKMSCITNLQVVNGRASTNQVNTTTNTISSSGFVFTIKKPEDFPITGYSEEYIIRIIIVREKVPNQPNLGAILSDVLYLINDRDNSNVDPVNYINCSLNHEKSENYQILASKIIYMSSSVNESIQNIAMSFTSEALLNYSPNNTGPQNAILGNFYICAVKSNIRSNISITAEDRLKYKNLSNFEIFKEKKRILNNFNLSTQYPVILADIKHVIT